MPLEIPSRPWERVGVDLFTFDNKDFLITVDYLRATAYKYGPNNGTSRKIDVAHFLPIGLP